MSDDSQSVVSSPRPSSPAIASITAPPVAPLQNAGKPTTAQSSTQSAPEITLDQFGIELSHRDRRVELLNAFVFAERQAAHFKDSKANFLARFAAFADQPA
jgi:hypothetical protein